MIQPSYDEFIKLTQEGNIIPVYKTVSADLLTPVLAYLKIAVGASHTFLLESVEGGEKIARYSFLGCNPFLVIRATGETIEIFRQGRIAKRRGFLPDVIQKITERYKAVKLPGLPPFSGGAVGYFAYDAIRWAEDIPQHGRDELQMEDGLLMFFSNLLAFDHVRQQIMIISNVILDEENIDLSAKYQKALKDIQILEEMLDEPAVIPEFGVPENRALEIRSNFSKPDYFKAVDKAKEHIRIGDIFQVVLSQRFTAPITADPFNIYRALRIVNPSPYMFFLKIQNSTIIGSSPEMLVRVSTNGTAYYRPIAGTRPRGENETDDALLEAELKADEKEKAEHVMLVDLGRNDLGKVCEYGSVEVDDLMFIEKYSHVMHLVSSLHGQLRPDVNRFSALMSCFPAGTVTGAPKVRAMQIIDELEPHKRGVYAGAILYLDFSGNLDSCIAIRTLVTKDGKAYIQAGGGIVADSVPEKEYQETINKSRALIKAVEMAEQGFK